MVPDAEFSSYYGRPILKAAPWGPDIPAYLFLGGLAGASSVLAAGADLTGRSQLRRSSRLTALGALGLSFGALVHDLGRPSRFGNMLRVAKVTSPMSVGTWVLTAFGPPVGVAAAAELSGAIPAGTARRTIDRVARPAGFVAAALGPAVASYTAVLVADTATPTWHDSYRELPFVFVGSAASAAGGMGMLTAPVAEAGPARRMAVGGAALELAAMHRLESSIGLTAEPLHEGRAGLLMRANKLLAAASVVGTAFAGRSRAAAVAAGVAALASSACGRFGIFYAGQASAGDPKYTVLPQRERVSAP
jgi:formate-dependent nitrite reductase membrane component NrfD